MQETKKRMRLTGADVISTVEDAERGISDLRSLKRKQQAIIDEAREAIQPILREARHRYEAVQARCEAIMQALHTWWEKVKHTYKTKSVALGNGKLGYRVVGGGWNMPPDNDLLAMLKDKGRDDLIVITEKPDKQTLKKKDYADLRAELGIEKREGEDQFFVQIEGDPVSAYVQLMALLGSKKSEDAA